jgi:hypothetical protein
MNITASIALHVVDSLARQTAAARLANYCPLRHGSITYKASHDHNSYTPGTLLPRDATDELG